MTKSPTETSPSGVIARAACAAIGDDWTREGPQGLATAYTPVAAAIIAALRESGWIIVRHDAIRLAQAHARDERRGGSGPMTVF
jgi:hypothetical protein